MLKYQNFQAPISKRDVFIQKGSNVMIYAKAKWKASKLCNQFVGGHICSFLEASLWFKDYFTLDTHPQHTRLWFNEYLSHLLLSVTWTRRIGAQVMKLSWLLGRVRVGSRFVTGFTRMIWPGQLQTSYSMPRCRDGPRWGPGSPRPKKIKEKEI